MCLYNILADSLNSRHIITFQYMGTVTEELSLQGYKNHILSVGSTAPMTDAEKELAQVSSLINSNKLFNFISFLKYYT